MNKKESDSSVSHDELVRELDLFFGEQSLRDLWVTAPLPILQGKCPSDLMKSRTGRARVMMMLQEMRFGETA
mgnify:CR=1 FL=1